MRVVESRDECLRLGVEKGSSTQRFTKYNAFYKVK